MRYVLQISYDGTLFSGFQSQPKERTVQGELERAAAEIFGVPVKVSASGRTDAGVHAQAQICHLDGDTAVPPEKLRECFNRILPPDLKVIKSGKAPDGFDCTRGAKRKTYCYTLYCSASEQPLLSRYATRVKELPDIARMREAAALLIGEHDFKAFCASGSSAKTSVREIYSAEVEDAPFDGGTRITVTVTGNGFLYNMVRILTGELYAVGCGKAEGITAAFRTGSRTCLARTMPPQGLSLVNVDYGFPLFEAENK